MSRSAFTLVELICIILVLAILSGVAIPKFVDIGARARQTAMLRHIQIVSDACRAYQRDFGAVQMVVNSGDAQVPEFAQYFQPETWRSGPFGPWSSMSFQSTNPGYLSWSALAIYSPERQYASETDIPVLSAGISPSNRVDPNDNGVGLKWVIKLWSPD